MRAYAVERFGSAPAILDLSGPTAPDGYVVRVTYAGVNPLDYKLVDNLTPQSSYLFVLGIDFAGVLEYVPSTERELRAGDRVFGIARTHGSYAEYTAVPPHGKAEALARIPEPIGDDQAAALPIAGITALGAVDFTGVAADQCTWSWEPPGRLVAKPFSWRGRGGRTSSRPCIATRMKQCGSARMRRTTAWTST